ncbi:uncharacterized protein LOC116215643 [Punica granatum]|uniref:Uncharacterized protein LOC116215643 n=2 Tax=Punica granatum TaxID=22663 RepID=A0A218XAU9_PUNGR|nr:uncharacterized protein LOC116215643 [Punica granatum]OWM81826.1 hypothetical protein CDL15_Pgr007864 [Punica granatum]
MFDGGLAFSMLNYPPCKLIFADNPHRVVSNRARLNPVQAIPPSSVILHTDESDNLPEAKKRSGPGSASKSCDATGNSLLSQSNTIGIIGGASVDSTLSFVQKLTQRSSKDGECSLPFVLCSDPVLSKELLLHEIRSFPLISTSRPERPNSDPKLVVETLTSKQAFLEKSGARCIVMPCHISHSWHNEVSEGSSVPFLHMADCVAKELKDTKMKPLEAGSPLRIGLLATDAILSAGFYQEKLQNEGFEVVLPDKATMEHTVIPAIEASIRKDMEGAQNLLRIALQVLLVRAVNTVILASDDMRDLLPPDDPLLKKCFDPMDSLVRSTIEWAKSAEKSS